MKIKIGIKVPQGTCNWRANFQLKRPKVNVTGRKKTQQIAAYLAHMLKYGRLLKSQLQTIALTLSAPEMLDDWTDGRISYRHSAPTCFLVIF